ncbi:MAG TPA: PLP-dependent aminotransferase family protein [Vicinamibacterales bacterium]|nr:PLP-dependent aminotransferase family protein [Vicinamibacterales bacterium]
MTIRLPPRGQRTGPIYQTIADQIGREVEAGRMKPGSRLPTQRALAKQLGVTLTTVTRAYDEAQRRGLLTGEVGRGTFVRPAALDMEGPEQGVLDLALNALMPLPYTEELADRLTAAIPRTAGARVFAYQPQAGARHNRAAGSAWIGYTGLEAPVDRVIVTGGGQHAILLSLMAVAKPGDEILVEEFTYPGMHDLASHLHLRLRQVALDKDGMLPDALEAACRTGTPAALYCMPSFQNPTAALMPEARRRQIADIAIRHNLMVIEDDVYGFLAPDAKPLSTFLPESQFLFITSTSKSIAPGIRIGYLLAPSAMIERLSVAVLRTVVNAAPAMAELATSLITDGVASRIVEWKRKEIGARQEIAQRVLQGLSLQTHPQSPHIWVRLPEPWQTDAFITRARHRGIMLTGADSFAVGHETDLQAIRIAIGPPATRSALEEGLSELVQMVHHVPEAYELVV